MQRLDAAYREGTGLSDRRYYSMFYVVPARSDFLMLNANPGGSPDNFHIVNVAGGQHEYIEGANSGRTTRNGAELLRYLVGTRDPEGIRHVQVSNISFRRSPDKSRLGLPFSRAVQEAEPFVRELLIFIQPKAILFAGDKNLHAFARAHGAGIKSFPEESLFGPNGTHEACYFARYLLDIPYLNEVDAYTIFHPSKMNSYFRAKVLPVLGERLREFVAP